ncbi:MAG: serine/threonine-protein kinase [Myxococcota bacterium]
MLLASEPSADFPYRIEGKIGEGAMGEVYRATELSLGRPVAIKVLKTAFLRAMDPAHAREATQRFLQEARAAASLSHPGIATIYRIGESGGAPYIAMEWLDGTTAEELIDNDAPLPVARVARLAVDVLGVLSAAHSKGIIHRDIKPGNLIVTRDERLKVVDFGVARMRQSELVRTQAGSLLGTPLYSAPEQVRGIDVDTRADIYSVGVIMYEALTGQIPYPATTSAQLIEMLLGDYEPELPEFHNSAIPSGLSAIVRAAMRKDRDQRFASAEQMAAAVAAFAPDRASVAQPHLSRAGTSAGEPSAASAEVTARPAVVAGHSPLALVGSAIAAWPGRSLGQQPVGELVERLVDRPVHAPAFAGAARVGEAVLLIHDGMIYAVFDPRSERISDAVYEALPEVAPAQLHPVPDDLDPRVIPALAALMHRPKIRHGDLDSSFVDLVQLVGKLIREEYSGAVRFERHGQLAYLLIEHGRPLLHLFSDGWPIDPRQQAWPSWVAQIGVTACVMDRRVVLSALSYRRELAEFQFILDPAGAAGAASSSTTQAAAALDIRPADDGQAPAGRGRGTVTAVYASAPLYRFLVWMIGQLPRYIAERDRSKAWKYLVSWIPLIRRATLHCALPRPRAHDSDFFDLVTQEDDGRVLHVVHRVAHGTADALRSFVERARAAKKARTKTGDIGGACLIAPSFDEDTLAQYRQLTTHEDKSLLFSLQESMTGYEGFVRLGARRGFHLLLVTEGEDGFTPLLPTAS